MNREQAKIYLRSSGFSEEQIDTIEQAFKDEFCEDAISRQAAIDAINRLSIHNFAYEVKTGWIVRGDAVYELRQLPSVTCSEKPNRSGEWIPNPPFMAKCSLCGYIQSTNGADLTGKALVHKAIYKYCPNCGAKMEVEE